MKLNKRETATVLAALRNWKEATSPEGGNDPRELAPEIFADVAPLSTDEIDDLCEKINLQCKSGDQMMKKKDLRGRGNVAGMTSRDKDKGCSTGTVPRPTSKGVTMRQSVRSAGVTRPPTSGVRLRRGMFTLEESRTARHILRDWFPWLGTDEEVGGADTVDQLNDLYNYLNV